MYSSRRSSPSYRTPRRSSCRTTASIPSRRRTAISNRTTSMSRGATSTTWSRETSDMSFDVILPFLRPIAHLIQDPDVTEIMVNGSRRIFVERQGLIEAVDGIEIDERNLKVAVKNIARALGDDVSEEKPILDSRLPDGSRVAAVFPPCSVGGTTLTIRKFQTRFFTVEELVRIGTMSPEVLAMVRAAIERNENVLISGGTSTGKTTLLNALAAFLPANDRVVLIEDTAELQIDRPNLVRFEAAVRRPTCRR